MAAFYHYLALSIAYNDYLGSKDGSWSYEIMGLSLIGMRFSEVIFLVGALEDILGGVARDRANVTKGDFHEEGFKYENFSSWWGILSSSISTAFMLPRLLALLFQ